MEQLYAEDDYKRMLVQTLSDRLAEATAEKLHEDVRKKLWGYAPDENLSVKDLHNENIKGYVLLWVIPPYPTSPSISY